MTLPEALAKLREQSEVITNLSEMLEEKEERLARAERVTVAARAFTPFPVSGSQKHRDLEDALKAYDEGAGRNDGSVL